MFLHTPILMTEVALRQLVTGQQVEDEHLEVKAGAQGGSAGDRWRDKFALGVAGMMNRHGGDFIFGLVTKPNALGQDQITGFSTLWAGDEVPEPQLRDVLQNLLDPREAAATVLIERVAFTDQGREIVCTAVRVPPWPHGVVSVMKEEKKGENNARNKRLDYSFPIRDGDKRRFLPLPEAMMRSDAAARRTELTLRQLRQQTLDVLFASGVHLLRNGRLEPVHLPLGQAHARLNEIGPNVVRLAVKAKLLTALNRHWHALDLRDAEARSAATRTAAAANLVDEIKNRRVARAEADNHMSLPLQLVASAWDDWWSGKQFIFVAIDGFVAWDGQSIRIIPK